MIQQFVDGMDFGVGYDALSGEMRGDWVKTTDPPPPKGGQGQEISFQLHKVNSTQELAQHLDFSTNANINCASFIQGSATAAFLSKRKINRYSVYLLLRVLVKNSALRMRDVELKQQARKLLESPGGVTEFRKRAGDEFIVGIISGGEYIGLIEIEANSEEQKDQISGEISADISRFGVDANFSADCKKAISNISKKCSTKIFSLQRGGQQTKVPQNIEEMIIHAANFPPSVKDSFGKPLQAIFLDYGSLNIPANINLIDIKQAKEIITYLWNRQLKYVDVLSNIEYILQNPNKFESFDSHELQQKATEVSKQIENLISSAKECARDCQNYRLSDENLIDLVVELPERKKTEHPLSPTVKKAKRDDLGSKGSSGTRSSEGSMLNPRPGQSMCFYIGP